MLARLRDAVLVLRGYQLTYEPEDAEDRPAGPARFVECVVQPGDRAAARGVKDGPRGPLVVFAMRINGQEAQVAAKPREARAFAAGILDSADEADGRTPLLMFPTCKHDEAEEPA